MDDLEYYVKKHGFLKGVKTHMEINFLKDKPLEEINELFCQLSNKINELNKLKLELENKTQD